jgi:hypothetical protein
MKDCTMTRKVCLPLLLLVVVGCGPSNPNAPGSVSGQVIYKGEALTAGTVGFHNKDKGLFGATIRPDGTFVATDIPTGEMVVTVETESANPNQGKGPIEYKGGFGGGAEGKYGKGGKGQQQGSKKAAQSSPAPEGANKETASGKYVKIPAKYADPAKSDLKLTIKAGKNGGLKFELTD